jgi:aspartate--ammonia ligase
LAESLNLQRVTAPLFVRSGTGINDDLNGVEQPLRFRVKSDDGAPVEIVQSLAKWKRLALARYGFRTGEGLYTDMNAIRPDETLDNIHSIYVDQWDWEKIIPADQRNLATLKAAVEAIYDAICRTEFHIASEHSHIRPILPEKITFITSEELCARYPDLHPRQREDRICAEKKAVFVIGIGGMLPDGQPHDGRAPDYDDWTTPNSDGGRGLNGDILLWNPVLQRSFEISSMGIRVDPETLARQLGNPPTCRSPGTDVSPHVAGGSCPRRWAAASASRGCACFSSAPPTSAKSPAASGPTPWIQRCQSANITLL